MFESITLFAKPYNRVELPNKEWTENTLIHCTCELNLGFGDKVVWTQGNSIRLTQLIDFYNQLYRFESCRDTLSFCYHFTNNDRLYTLKVTKSETEKTYTIKRKYYKTESIVVQKNQIPICTSRESFYLEIMKQLTLNTNNKVSTKIGELFFSVYEFPANYEFQIGQKVKTILSETIKTKRVGYIINRFRHYKDQTNIYLLLENGKTVTTRYKPHELEAID